MKPGGPNTPEPMLTTPARWWTALERLEERMLLAADVDVALIDSTLPDRAAIVRAMQPGGKVFLYDGHNDSAEQILSRVTDWAERTGSRLRSISLMSHGAAGRFALGNDWITKSNLDETKDQWQRLGKVLADGASINLFGCNLIAGDGDGKVLINRLSKVVSATVFASNDLTGRGGDWVLEAASRTVGGTRAGIAAAHPFSVKKLSRWAGSLAPSLGSELLVNTTTTGTQSTHEGAQAIATDANGNFVIAWSGEGPGDTAGIFAQRYDALGVALGAEFRVNTTTTGAQTSPAVAMDADGDFVIVWSGQGTGDTTGIFAQRYDASGVAQGGEFIVNNVTANVQQQPSVAMSDAGSFVITWTSAVSADGTGRDIYMRRYDAAGVQQGGQTLVNFTTSSNEQEYSRVAMDAGGNFVVTWASVISTSFGWGIAAQRFAANGAALGSEIVVNSSYDNDQRYPAIAMASGGAFVIVWQSYDQDSGNTWGIYGQRFDAAGGREGGEFRINGTTANHQQYPSVGMDDAENFTVTWQSASQDGDGWGIYARDYDAAGTAQGSEYLVNTTTSGHQQYASAAMDVNGDFVIVWSGNGAGDGDGLFVQRYRSASAGITISQTSGHTTTESGGTSTFTVQLNHQPTSDVIVSFTSSDTAEGTVTSAVTFTPLNWNVAQTVTVTGVNDFIDDGDAGYTIGTTSSSSDAAYAGFIAADVSVTNSDDDTAGVIVSPTSGLTTTEVGGQATFTVILTSQPLGDVTISLVSLNTSEGTVSISSLTFTPLDWDVEQTVTVTGVNDFLDDGDAAYQIQTSAASTVDSTYDGMAVADVSLSNTDDDTAGILISPTLGLTTTEAGGMATFGVVLTSQPTANVTLSLASSNAAEGTVSVSSLTFTPADWNIVQTVTVTGVNDIVDDGDIAYAITTSEAVSGDALYNGMIAADVSLTNIDDDVAGFTITWLTDPETTEAGGTAQFELVLNSRPTSAVIVSIDVGDVTEGSATPNVYSLGTSNWNQPRLITVTGLDDALMDGDITYLVHVSTASSDPSYDNLAQDLSVTNLDDDTPGITVTPTSGLIVTEAGGTATFAVVLDAAPAQDVLIDVVSGDASEGTLSVMSLLFTPADWSTPQFVIVSGVDDFGDDGDVTFSIILLPARSDDANYDGIDPADVTVTNIDNDTVGITVTPLGAVTTEAGGTASYTVVLDSQPSADVIITIFSRDTSEGQVSATSLLFTPGNWDQPQTVIVTGVDDMINDGDIEYVVVNGLTESDDPQYDGLNPANVTLTNQDDDAGQVVVLLTTPPLTTEGGGSATLNIVLDSAPTVDVIVQLISSDEGEGTISNSTLIFTSTDWNVVRVVTVSGVDDDIVDGDAPFTIGITTSSSDPDFDALAVGDVALTNLDTTVSAPTISTSAGTLDITENDAPRSVDSAVVVEDANGMLAGATVRIIANYVRGEDRLRFAGSDGIAGAWNATTGTLTLTGAATVEQYQAALRSVTYENTSDDPSSEIRTVRFIVSDGQASASATRALAVEPVNDAPIGAEESYTAIAGSSLTVDAGDGVLANDLDAEEDILSAVLVTPPALGQLTLNSDGSFTYVAGANASGTDTFVYQTMDGQDASDPVTVSIEVNEVPPVVPADPPDPPQPPPADPVEEPEPAPPEKPERPKSARPRHAKPASGPTVAPVARSPGEASPAPRLQQSDVPRARPVVVLTRAAYVEVATVDHALLPEGIIEAPPHNPDVTVIDIAALPKWEVTETLSSSLDQLADELAAGTQTTNTAATVVGSAALVWVGYVVYSLRGGALLLTFLTSMPLWRTLDPLPVLEASEARAARRKNKRKRDRDQEDPDERNLRSVLG